MEDFDRYDAVGLAELVRNEEVTPPELVDEVISRIERVNPKLNGVTIEMYDRALDAARRDVGMGPFAGVPFLLKDFLAECADVEYSASSRFLQGFVPDRDTELVRRFKQGGFITVGKTNLPEFAIGATTEPRLRGPTRNPWDTGRTPGGSSGGAGAMVAAGAVPVAHGNDAGGSIRIPAAACGTVGLKPTRGRNPLGPYFGELFSGFVAEHVLTRTVRDTAAVLDVTSGPDVGDWYPAPEPAQPFIEEVGAPTGRLRIAFSAASPTGTEVHPDCVLATREAAALCEDLGHEVVEGAPDYDAEGLWFDWTTMMSAGVAWAVRGWERRLGRKAGSDELEPFIWALVERGGNIDAPSYLEHLERLQLRAREIGRFFLEHDVWLTPTLGEPPLPLGVLTYDSGDPFELRRRQARFSPFTYIANVTGQPGISLPLAWNRNTLPIGVHFLGRYGDEATLLRLSSQLEEARPWKGRRPPVSA